jgi:hypothetical protein
MRDLYAIATDLSPESRLVSIDVATGARTQISTLGSRFRGGMAYRPASRLIFALSEGTPSLPRHFAAIFPADGRVAFRQPLNVEFGGGLAYHPGDNALYAIRNVTHPDLARIHRINFDGSQFELFQLGQARFGGLVYVPVLDRFFAAGTDQQGLTWLYSFNLQGAVAKLFVMATRANGGLTYATHENRFYFAAEQNDGTCFLHRLALSGTVDRLTQLGPAFNTGALIATPWFGATINIKRPLIDERFVDKEPVTFDANVLDVNGRETWDSTGMTWQSNRDGALGEGTIVKQLSVGTHTITANIHGVTRTIPVRVFTDLWALYQSPPAQGEIDRILSDFVFEWLDGDPTKPEERWATFPGFPFDQTSANPSRTAVIAKLDILRHQRFSEPTPFPGAPESLYDHVKRHTRRIRVTLARPLNQAGGGIIDLNRGFTEWSGMFPYVHNLYLLIHENRHNEPGEPLHATCNGWEGTALPPASADQTFDPGSGYAAAAKYLFWVHRYSLYDPPNIKAEARSASMSQRMRFCQRPSSTNPKVQALLVELWNV